MQGMDFKVRGGNINILVNDLKGWGSLITSDLLINTLLNYARRNYRFHKATKGDLLFPYTEKSLQSVLYSSISDLGAVVFAEEPIRRKETGEEESHGWADLWIYYRNLTYIAETKHDGVSWRTSTLSKSSKVLWKEAVSAIKKITPESVQYCAIHSDGISKLAILTLRIFRSSKYPEKLTTVKSDQIIDFATKICSDIRPKVTWSAVWALSPRLQNPVEGYDDEYISYPGLLLLAWVDGPNTVP